MKTTSLVEQFSRKINPDIDESILKSPLKLEGNDREKNKLARATMLVMKSKPYGQHAIATLKKHNYTIVLANMDNLQGLCDPDKKIIYLGANFDDERLAFTLVHEAAHAEQYSKYTMEDFGINNLQSEIMLTRILEADADVKAMIFAHDMRERGNEGIYEKMAKDSPEIATAFEKSINEDPINISNGKALEASFDAWFDNSSNKFSYEKSYYVKELTNITEREQEDFYTFEKDINPHEIVNKICVSHDGKPYYKQNAEILKQGKYVDIASATKMFFDAWFEGRKGVYGIAADSSLKNLPVRIGTKSEPMGVRSIVSPSIRSDFGESKFNKSLASTDAKSAIIRMRSYFSH